MQPDDQPDDSYDAYLSNRQPIVPSWLQQEPLVAASQPFSTTAHPTMSVSTSVATSAPTAALNHSEAPRYQNSYGDFPTESAVYPPPYPSTSGSIFSPPGTASGGVNFIPSSVYGSHSGGIAPYHGRIPFSPAPRTTSQPGSYPDGNSLSPPRRNESHRSPFLYSHLTPRLPGTSAIHEQEWHTSPASMRRNISISSTHSDAPTSMSMGSESEAEPYTVRSHPFSGTIATPHFGGAGNSADLLPSPTRAYSPERYDTQASVAEPAENESTGTSQPISQQTSSSKRAKKGSGKRHKCEICTKTFPRPSGLRTHMNTHNNLKPYKCSFPGCAKAFAVRSNAKRHLRTHGVLPDAKSPAAATITFEEPLVNHQQSTSALTLDSGPRRLTWIPESLSTRSNRYTLSSVRDDGEGEEVSAGEDDGDAEEDADVRLLSFPLPPSIPTTRLPLDHPNYEERNSYAPHPEYPYHPSQFRILPGPALSSRRALASA